MDKQMNPARANEIWQNVIIPAYDSTIVYWKYGVTGNPEDTIGEVLKSITISEFRVLMGLIAKLKPYDGRIDDRNRKRYTECLVDALEGIGPEDSNFNNDDYWYRAWRLGDIDHIHTTHIDNLMDYLWSYNRPEDRIVERCSDCAYLYEANDGVWMCDHTQQPCAETDDAHCPAETTNEENDIASYEEMMAEAVDRLKMLNLYPSVLNAYSEDGTIYYSENDGSSGLLRLLENEESWNQTVRLMEMAHSICVYHVTHEHTNIGETLTMLYVPENKNEWEQERQDLQVRPDGKIHPTAWVWNMTTDDVEAGYVGLMKAHGGLVRVS